MLSETIGSVVKKGLPRGLSGKEPACQAGDAGDPGLIPESERSPGEGHGNLLQYSCLGNPMDREFGGLRSTGSQGRPRLSDCTAAEVVRKKTLAGPPSLHYISLQKIIHSCLL